MEVRSDAVGDLVLYDNGDVDCGPLIREHYSWPGTAQPTSDLTAALVAASGRDAHAVRFDRPAQDCTRTGCHIEVAYVDCAGHIRTFPECQLTPPVARYSFDAGSPGLDGSGHGHDGVALDGIARDGVTGAALSYAANDTVEFSVPHSEDLNITGPMTGIAWIMPSEEQAVGDPPGCQEGTIFTKGGENWFQIGHDRHDLVFQNAPSGAPGDVARVPLTAALPTDTWSQVAFVREAGGLDIRFYLNGAYIGTGTVTQEPAISGTYRFEVGNSSNFAATPGCEFAGAIDQLSIHDSACDDAGIQAEYSKIRPPLDVPLTSPLGAAAAAIAILAVGLRRLRPMH